MIGVILSLCEVTVFLVHDVEPLEPVQCISTLEFIVVDPADVGQHLDLLSGDVRARPPTVGQREKRGFVHFVNHVVPVVLGLSGGFDGFGFGLFEFLNHRHDKVALHLDDGRAVGEGGGCCRQ